MTNERDRYAEFLASEVCEHEDEATWLIVERAFEAGLIVGREDGEKELEAANNILNIYKGAVTPYDGIGDAVDQLHLLRIELATSQAREAQLREALEGYVTADQDIDSHRETRCLLALPSNQSALDAALEKARSEERGRCAKIAEGGSFLHHDAPDAKIARACADAIRALEKELT